MLCVSAGVQGGRGGRVEPALCALAKSGPGAVRLRRAENEGGKASHGGVRGTKLPLVQLFPNSSCWLGAERTCGSLSPH